MNQAKVAQWTWYPWGKPERSASDRKCESFFRLGCGRRFATVRHIKHRHRTTVTTRQPINMLLLTDNQNADAQPTLLYRLPCNLETLDRCHTCDFVARFWLATLTRVKARYSENEPRDCATRHDATCDTPCHTCDFGARPLVASQSRATLSQVWHRSYGLWRVSR